MNYPNVKAIVLAAGKGKRLGSEEAQLPKVMREACARPMLSYVLHALSFINPQDTVIVVGYMADKITQAFGNAYRYAEQAEQLGTGHAASCAMKALSGFDGTVLLCYGDMPLVGRETYEALIQEHLAQKNACTLLAGVADAARGYGRVVLDESGGFSRVVEERDCTPEEKEIKLLNAGIYLFDAKTLARALPKLQNQNAQGEYYVTDVPALFLADGLKVGVFKSRVENEILGVNTLEQLQYIEDCIRERGLSF